MGYIRNNKNFYLIYYAKIEDEFLSELLRQASIKTENQLMVSYDSIYTDCPDIGRSTEVYIVFYQGGHIDHFKHVPGPFYQSSSES